MTDRKPKTMPYGEIERDLCNLASERVRDAIRQTLQLADSKETAFLITVQTMVQAVSMCGGAYDAVYGGERRDPFETAKIIFDLVRDSRQ